MNEIIKKNLEKMVGENETDMDAILMRESMGGNAGRWHGFSCQAANFYFLKWNGKIICFGNIQDVPAEIRKDNPQGTFRLALNNILLKYRIVDLILPENVSVEAKKNLYNTLEEWNRQYGFSI